MSDLITINDLELWTRIGVSDEERASEQRLLLTIVIPTDVSVVAKNDDLSGSLDYDDLVTVVHEVASTERKTVETFAEDVCVALLKLKGVQKVTLTVRKFVIPGTRDVSLTIERSVS